MVYLPLVHNMRVWGYDNLMVDEAQDLNLSRMLLAKKMIRRGGRFIFVEIRARTSTASRVRCMARWISSSETSAATPCR